MSHIAKASAHLAPSVTATDRVESLRSVTQCYSRRDECGQNKFYFELDIKWVSSERDLDCEFLLFLVGAISSLARMLCFNLI